MCQIGHRYVPAALLLFATSGIASAADPKFTGEQVAFYEKEVLPLLKENCLKCHGLDAKKPKGKGGFNLLSRAATLEGGDTGPAIDLAKPDASLLLKAVHYKDEALRMPPAGKLTAAQIDTLTKWVKAGLPWSAGSEAGGATEKPTTGPDMNYWAYQPVKKPALPAVKAAAWVKTPIDAFVLSKLEAKGLKPVAAAEKAALGRRAYYDLTGLPPTPEQLDAFVKDTSPNAFERLLDALLASPQYGEKWGRHWLDIVRYAETNGYERDGPKPNAWRYRDYVIRSFNADKPYDQFLREQIAGDELAPDSADAIVATGFYRLGVWDDEPADKLLAIFDGYDDLVTVVGQGVLGMTMNCTRCHDHKGDYFPQSDYYKMVAFFRDIRPYSDNRDVRSSNNMTDITPIERRRVYEAELKQREARIAEIAKQMTSIEDAAIKTMSAEDQRASEGPDRPTVVRKATKFLNDPVKTSYQKLKLEIEELRKKAMPNQELALSVNNGEARPPTTHVLIRGNPTSIGKEVSPGFPTVFKLPDPKIPTPKAGAKSSGRRSALAEFLASKENPLTARVMVNRVWQYHFGRGIVPTPNDFGKFGEKPSDPQLLDWLAAEFMAGDWKLKRLHKTIMLSNTYQLSAKADADSLKVDPANGLHWRFDMRRLGAEEVRDSILVMSGNLNAKMHGPSVYPKIPQAVLAGQSVPGSGWPTSSKEDGNRRSIYVHVKRSLQVPILVTHDQADTDSSCPVRYTTTVPTQALGMLNGEFANDQAAAFAERLKKEHPGDLNAQIARAVRLTTGRTPGAEEVSKDAAFVKLLVEKYEMDESVALTRYCLLLLNANEFVYVD